MEATKPKRKRIKDLNGIELRMKARQDLDPRALVELERRRDNLAGAVIPAWEREARGEDPLHWDLVA